MKKNIMSGIIVFCLLFMLATYAQAKVIYVKSDSTGTGDGSSWTNAFVNLQPAIDAAASSDQVWVTKGTYKPASWPNGSVGDERAKHFSLKNGVIVYGGFIGTETLLSQRDYIANETICSGDIGTIDDSSDNCYHVFYHPSGTSLVSTAIIDGFKVTGGKADNMGNYKTYMGGGFFNESSSPIIRNCNVANNSAYRGGGFGSYLSSSMNIINCTIQNNISSERGGGVYSESCGTNFKIIDSTISGNVSSSQGGGGIYNHYSPVSILTSKIQNNSGSEGGGIFNWHSDAIIMDCTLNSNTGSNSGGGGISNEYSNSSISNCTFKDNAGSGTGGGIYNYNASPSIVNCTFTGNNPGGFGYGGGIANSTSSSPTISNCTLSGNRAGTIAGSKGGGIYNEASSNPAIKNTILWGNAAPDGSEVSNSSSTPTLSYCVVTGGYAGGTNIISDDPQLATLADNAGATQTIAVPVNSSANVIPQSAGGNWNGSPSKDQRGYYRNQSFGVRAIGAFDPSADATVYTVTVLSGANGTVSGLTTQIIGSGENCSEVTAVPNTGSHFVNWTGAYSGTTNPLTILNVTADITVTATFAENGDCAEFSSGSSSYISVPSSSELNPTNALTIETWVKPVAGGGEWALIMGKQWNPGDSNPWYSYRFCAASADSGEKGFPRRVAFNVLPEGNGSEVGVVSTTVVPVDEWTHLAGVYDGTNLKIYVNGVMESSTPVSGNIWASANPLYIGKAPWIANNYNNFNGRLDEIRIWNIARTESQIKYAMKRSLVGNEQGLVAYWPFNDAVGSGTANDASPNNNVGTLNNGAAIVADSTVQPHLVSWWKAEDDANDSIGTNHGAEVGDATYANGKVGRAFSFDGTGDAVRVPASQDLHVTSFTTAAWIKPAVSAVMPIFEWNREDGVLPAFGPELIWTQDRLWGNITDQLETHIQSDTGLISPGIWTHVAYTYDAVSGNSALYINGLQVGNGNVGTPGLHTEYPVFIGSRPSAHDGAGGVFGFNGLIDEVEIHDCALSADEITILYEQVDFTPDTFIFTAQTGVPLSTTIVSNPITVTGINCSTDISITGGDYAVSTDAGSTWGAWTNSSSTVILDSQVKVRQTSSASNSTSTSATLAIGGVNASFDVATASASDPNANGLVSWWKADSNALDSVGGNHGTLQGGVAYANSLYGKAFSLDGSNDYVSVGDGSFPSGNSDRTISLWIKTGQSGEKYVFSYGSNNANQRFSLGMYDSRFHVENLGSGSHGDTVVNDNSWHHLAAVWASSSLKLFVDGNEQQMTVVNSWPPVLDTVLTGEASIGRLNGMSGYDFNGLVDDVRIYSRALSTGEVATLSSGPSIPASGLRLWVQADTGITKDGSGLVSSWADKSGNSFDLGQGTSARQPLLVDGACSGQPVIRFDGDNDYLQTSGAVNLLLGAAKYTLFLVTRPGTTQKDYADILDYAHAGGLNFVLQQNAGVTNEFGFSNSQHFSASIYQLYSDVFINSVTDDSYINGISHIQSAAANVSWSEPSFFSVGSKSLEAYPRQFNGDVAELIIYNEALSDANRLKVENYLLDKYGIDKVPDAFSFTDKTGMPMNTAIVSNPITVTGVNATTTVSITGGDYAVSVDNGSTWGDWTVLDGTINLNDQVKVRQTSSASLLTKTDATLTIGGVSDTFSVTTAMANYPNGNSLVSWWKGENNPDDYFGINNGTIINTVTYAGGEVGQAFDFDGSSSYVEMPAGVGNFGSDPFTVEFWIRPDNAVEALDDYLLGKSHPDGGQGWDIRYKDQTIKVCGVNGWGLNIISDASATANVWHHVALTATASDAALYIDGVSKGTSARSAISSTGNPFRIGYTTNYGSQAFSGLLDEISIYNYALTGSEVTSIFNAGISGKAFKFTLTYNAGSNGAISGELSQLVDKDDDGLEVTALPDTGYHFTSWSDAVPTAARTDTNITADKSVTAYFAINTYTVTFNLAGKGTRTGGGELVQTVTHGSDATAPAVSANPGLTFSGWDKAFDYVTSNLTVTAQYNIDLTTNNAAGSGDMTQARYLVNLGIAGGHSVTNPTSESGLYDYSKYRGNQNDWSILNDGSIDGSTGTAVTYGGDGWGSTITPPPDYFGYKFKYSVSVSKVVYTDFCFWDGGTFNGTPSLQYLSSLDGTWTTVAATWDQPYNSSFAGGRRVTYTITPNVPLDNIWGLRLYGDTIPTPGAWDSNGWVCVTELQLYGVPNFGSSIYFDTNLAQAGTPICSDNAWKSAPDGSEIIDGNFDNSNEVWDTGEPSGDKFVGISWALPQDHIGAIGFGMTFNTDGGWFVDTEANPLKVQYTTDGTTWHDVQNLDKGRYTADYAIAALLGYSYKGSWLLTFDSASGAIGIRLIGLPGGNVAELGGNGYVSIREMQMFQVVDTMPDAFAFLDQTDVDPSTVITSNTITVTGINGSADISIESCTGTAGQYKINNGSWTSDAGTVTDGDTVTVRQTSSAIYSTKTDLVLDIGDVSDTFSVTTFVMYFTFIENLTDITVTGYTGAATAITIPGLINGKPVTSIAASAFSACTSLTSVTIPASVTSIGNDAFVGCSALTSISVSPGNLNYMSESGVLFNIGKTILVQYPGGKSGAYTVPDSVTSIENSAFRNCTGLTSVTISDSVTSIGNEAFRFCNSGLKPVFLGNAPATFGTDVFDAGRIIYYIYGATGFTPNCHGYATATIVTGVSVKTAPAKITYIAGEALDLTGLVVTLTKLVGADQDVALADFAANGITTIKANGAVLATADTAVVITVNGKTANRAITVKAVISTAAIAGVTVPVTGETPTETIATTSEYTATISWVPGDYSFAPGTEYTATVTITPKPGYTLTGVAENFFKVAGATTANAVNSGVVTAVFPQTDDAVIATAEIAGATAPTPGATPAQTIAETTEYTAVISWLPSDAEFAMLMVYTARITITPKAGYTLTGVPENFFKVAGATATNPINSGVVTAVFPATSGVTFEKTDYTSGTNPMSVATGDFNKDGKADLATANFGGDNVSILMGKGDGTFDAKVDYPVGTSPKSIATGDFNGDGNPDLAVANYGSKTVSILLGDGLGGFVAGTDCATGNYPGSVTTGDFNMDDNTDLAVANETDDTVLILLGDGLGGFVPGAPYAAGIDPVSVATGDLNNDNLIDLIVANKTTNTTNYVSIMMNDGLGGFVAGTPCAAGFAPSSVVSDDFDKDGKADIAAANYGGNTASILMGKGDGTFDSKVDYTTGDGPYSVTTGDFNMDGCLDMAVANSQGDTVSILLGDGLGAFGANTDYVTGSYAVSVITGDFNGDGKTDLAVANYIGDNVSILLNTTITYTLTSSSGLNGSITPSATVGAGSSKAFTITPATNYHVADVLVDGSTVGAVASYTFTNVTANHTISASFAINTYTLTSSAGASGSITPTATVDHGAGKTFTITPAANYHVADVLVDGSSVGAVASYTFTNVTANHTISASFAINTYTLTSSAGASGSITPTATVDHGAGKTFTITPAANYHVADVLVDSVSVGAVTSYPFTNVTANHTISASFAINTFTLTSSAGPNGLITATTTVDYGAGKTFTITPATGYHIADVLVDSVSVGAVTSYPFTNVTANHTIAASFAINTYTLTVNNGTGDGSYAAGTIVDIAANPPETGKEFDSWVAADSSYLSSLSDPTDSTTVFTMPDSNATIIATYKDIAAVTHTIMASAGPNGSIAPSGTVTVNDGASQSFAISASAGYHVADLLVDGSTVGAVASYTFTNVVANHTISANFAANTAELAYSVSAFDESTVNDGSIDNSVPMTITISGDSFTGADGDDFISESKVAVENLPDGLTAGITKTSDAILVVTLAGKATDHLSTDSVGNLIFTFADGAFAGNNASSVINFSKSDISVNFYDYTITANAGANGSILPDGITLINNGAGQSLAISADAGYHVADVLVDGGSVGAVASYTFTNVTANHTISANFAIDAPTLYMLTVNAGSGDGSYAAGTVVTITADAPAAGKVFDKWTGDVANVANVNVSPTTITMPATNATVTATYKDLPVFAHTITASAGANGSIAPSGMVTVNEGANQLFAISASAGYHVADVLVDGGSVGAVANYTFTNVTANHTISANFAINTCTLTYTAGENGSITGTSPQTVDYGTSGTQVTAVPDTGYNFVGWSDGVSTAARTDENVTADITVTANFEVIPLKAQLTMVAAPEAGGSTTPGEASTVYTHTLVKITATPNAEYNFMNWTATENATITNANSASTTVTLIGDSTVTANFAAVQATAQLTMAVSPVAAGTTIPTGTSVVNTVEAQAITASAAEGYYFMNWSASTAGAVFGDASAAETTVTVDADTVATANFAVLPDDTDMAYGRIYATGAESAGLANFAKAPKIYAQYVDPVKGGKAKKASLKVLDKIIRGVYPAFLNCEWRGRMALFDKKLWDKTLTCEENLSELGYIEPLTTRLFVSGMDSTGKKVKEQDTQIDLILIPPEITGVHDAHGEEIFSALAGDVLTVKGTFFGSAPPMVWMEYPVYDKAGDIKEIKALKLKISKVLKYPDAKKTPGKSCMDIETGLSEITVYVPNKWPNKWDHSEYHNIVIDNKVGRATVQFQTEE